MAMVALAGCTTTGGALDPVSAVLPLDAACNAAAVQDLVGKAAATNAAHAKRRAGAATTRSYVSGSAATMDYRADRLNIETDAAGVIVKLSCS
jgi:hypothetical protein